MREHLSDQEIAESLDTDPSREAGDHLAACPTCRAERQRMQATVMDMAAVAREWADRPEIAWDRQARQIMTRARQSPRPAPRWRWAYAPALVGLAALAGIWFQGHTTTPVRPVESDEALLAGVQQAVRAEVPAALRPMALLLDAMEDDETTGGHTSRHGG